jgi:hypothetical protein
VSWVPRELGPAVAGKLQRECSPISCIAPLAERQPGLGDVVPEDVRVPQQELRQVRRRQQLLCFSKVSRVVFLEQHLGKEELGNLVVPLRCLSAVAMHWR